MKSNTPSTSATAAAHSFLPLVSRARTTFFIMLALVCLLGGASSSFADFSAWKAATLSSSPVATVFTTTSGTSPALVNVGTLSGAESFEFIYNAALGGPSQSLLGSTVASAGQQALKLDQYPSTEVFGVTEYGVADYSSTVPSLFNQNVDIIFTSDGVNTSMYLNGSLGYEFSGFALAITGTNGLGASSNGSSFIDNLAGNVLGFASYNSALSPAEVASHYQAYIAPVPEPGLAAVTLLAGVAAAWLRRR